MSLPGPRYGVRGVVATRHGSQTHLMALAPETQGVYGGKPDFVVQMTLGDRIALARKRAGLSQGKLATAVGAGDAGTVSDWENDKSLPEGRFLLKLPEVLGVSADWLLLGRVAGTDALIPPREALEALQEWMNQVLPPRGGSQKGGGGNGGT